MSVDPCIRWLLGETGDPLSVPFALFLERFSSRGFEEDPDAFAEEDPILGALVVISSGPPGLRRSQKAVVLHGRVLPCSGYERVYGAKWLVGGRP